MKRLVSMILAAALLAALALPAAADGHIPDMTGTWTGGLERHFKDKGFGSNPDIIVTYEILEQQGHMFHGVKKWNTPSGEKKSETFSGLVTADGKRLYIGEHEDGLLIGDIVDENHVVLYYLEHGDAPKAMYYDLTRQ